MVRDWTGFTFADRTGKHTLTVVRQDNKNPRVWLTTGTGKRFRRYLDFQLAYFEKAGRRRSTDPEASYLTAEFANGCDE
jgi:hypothetical protein